MNWKLCQNGNVSKITPIRDEYDRLVHLVSNTCRFPGNDHGPIKKVIRMEQVVSLSNDNMVSTATEVKMNRFPFRTE